MARKKGNPHNMTDQQWLFAQLYKTDPSRNATAAYRKAYPTCRSEKTAGVNASRLLGNARVQAYLQESTEKAMKKFDITEERILQELGCIAFLDFAELVDSKGNLKDINDIPEHSRRAIAGLEISEIFEGEGSDRRLTGLLKKLRTSDKRGALELLGKNLKMWTDRIEHDLPKVIIKDYTGED